MIAVTDRFSCKENFLKRIEKIYLGGAEKIILREKDLNEEEYIELAKKCLEICGGRLYINSRKEVAKKLGIKNIHLPLTLFDGKDGFENVGVSVHSVKDALKARELGADYLIAGHIFETDCKKGVPPRGVSFLADIVNAVDIPVYGIGGITPQNAQSLKAVGARGVCVMSSIMSCRNPAELIDRFIAIKM